MKVSINSCTGLFTLHEADVYLGFTQSFLKLKMVVLFNTTGGKYLPTQSFLKLKMVVLFNTTGGKYLPMKLSISQ